MEGSSRPSERILHLLKSAGGTLTTREMLVGWYKVYGEVKTREYIGGLVYQLSHKKIIFSTGKKGEYSLRDNRRCYDTNYAEKAALYLTGE
jgi:hypothetical protein